MKLKKIKKLKKRIKKRIKPKRFVWPHNNLFIIALLSLIVFLALEVVIRSYNLYKEAPLVDIPSHFFAGIALATILYWIVSLTTLRKKKFVVIFFTFVGASIWEVMETLEELIIYNPPYLRDFFFWDGFWDIIVTLVGGVLAVVILHMFKKTRLLVGTRL